MARPLELLLRQRSVKLRMNVEAAQPCFLLLLDDQRMCLGIGILPYTGDQPGDLHVRHAGFDLEPVICDLAGHDSLCKLANNRQLVAEICFLGLEPVGQRHCRIRLRIGDDVAGVDIHHLRRLHRSMSQILIGGVEWMIDSKIFRTGKDCAGHIEIAAEVARVTAPPDRVDTVPGEERVVPSLKESASTIHLKSTEATAVNSYAAGVASAAFGVNSPASRIAALRRWITAATKGLYPIASATAGTQGGAKTLCADTGQIYRRGTRIQFAVEQRRKCTNKHQILNVLLPGESVIGGQLGKRAHTQAAKPYCVYVGHVHAITGE